MNQQLEEQKKVTTEFQQTNLSLQRQVEHLQQQLSQRNERNPANQQYPPKERILTLTWRNGGTAPFLISSGAVVDGNVAYFVHYNGKVCSYNSTTTKWSKLRRYPYEYCSLAVINGQLTGIGGCCNVTSTNKLLSLRDGLFHGHWSAVFPRMPTRRHGTTAVVSEEHLIVAGGTTGSYRENNLNTVEVMNSKTLVWSTVASLPHPYNLASSTICGDHLYILGGLDDKDKIKLVVTCSLTELLQSPSSPSTAVWHRVADAPAYYSICAVVNGELLAVGGYENNKATSAVHKYNPTTNSWDLINNMPTARYKSLVAVLPTNEMIVVGGWVILDVTTVTDIVEFANF